MDIRLWKGYATSTPEEQHHHQEKWLRRLQKQMSGEPNSSITAAFSKYEVITDCKSQLVVQVTNVSTREFRAVETGDRSCSVVALNQYIIYRDNRGMAPLSSERVATYASVMMHVLQLDSEVCAHTHAFARW